MWIPYPTRAGDLLCRMLVSSAAGWLTGGVLVSA